MYNVGAINSVSTTLDMAYRLEYELEQRSRNQICGVDINRTKMEEYLLCEAGRCKQGNGLKDHTSSYTSRYGYLSPWVKLKNQDVDKVIMEEDDKLKIMEEIRDIELKYIEELKRVLAHDVQVLPQPIPVVQSYRPPIPFHSRFKDVMEEAPSNRKKEEESLIEESNPHDVEIFTTPNVCEAPVVNPILVKLTEEYKDELLNITMIEEVGDVNPISYVEGLERLFAKDPYSSSMEFKGHSTILETKEE
ncbi:hypothetical protein Tco_0932543 [Tanacetum coccineum]